jgi:hypothetical protein
MVLWATIRSTRTISAVTEPATLSVSALEQREVPVRAELEAGGAVDLADGRQRGRLDGSSFARCRYWREIDDRTRYARERATGRQGRSGALGIASQVPYQQGHRASHTGEAPQGGRTPRMEVILGLAILGLIDLLHKVIEGRDRK